MRVVTFKPHGLLAQQSHGLDWHSEFRAMPGGLRLELWAGLGELVGIGVSR